jgi:hypothetical protein
MNYYNPYLAAWPQGEAGQAQARLTNQLALAFNGALEQAYAAAGVPVADVETAFATTDFDTQVEVPGLGTLPRNVATVCRLTWMCQPPPARPNIHANTDGYHVIAVEFQRTLLRALLPGGLSRLARQAAA